MLIMAIMPPIFGAVDEGKIITELIAEGLNKIRSCKGGSTSLLPLALVPINIVPSMSTIKLRCDTFPLSH
mgnify:CR=1 FL=1